MRFIRKSQIIFLSCLSFIIGDAIASFFLLPWSSIYCGVIFGSAVIILTIKRTILRAAGWCLLFLLFGIVRYQLSIPVINENHLAYYNNLAEVKFSELQTVIFRGIINDEPDIRKDHVKLKVKSRELKTDNGWRPIQGDVLIKVALYPQYQYGDMMEISCALNAPKPIEEFRYDRYLAKAGIYSTCYRPKIKLLDSNRGSMLIFAMIKVKTAIIKVVGQILPEPQASFLGGLLWGEKKGLPENILSNFNRSGVTHIIAVSGYNITIIAVMLSNLFIALGISRRKSFGPVIACLVFFILLTGAPSSIVRAGAMGIVALLAQNCGRLIKMSNVLAITVVVMLLLNPKILIDDAGFQLSFLATIGLIYLSPIIASYSGRLIKAGGFGESLTATLSAIIVTTPLILYQFGRFSIIAPLANILILPVIPVNMALGFVAVVTGAFWLPLGRLIGYFLWLPLEYVLKVTEILGQISWSSVTVTNHNAAIMLIEYVILIWAMTLIYRRSI